MNYILDHAGNPVAEPDIVRWAEWLEGDKDKRRVAREMVGDVMVSTVFLGYDYADDGGPPVLWETMVFGGKLDQEQDRCSGNREKAEAMHARMVARVRSET